MSLRCAGCKAAIDDDSFFCDQCGIELMKCGMCGYVGKGKVCPHDRTPLLPAKALAATGGTSALAAASTPAVSPPAQAVAVMSPAVPSSAQAVGNLCLRSTVHGVQLRPAPGDLLGRRFGPHATVLERFAQISSKHLELHRDATGQWFGNDVGSYNHSFYNGRRLVPGEAQRLEPGATLSLGDVAFTVSFE